MTNTLIDRLHMDGATQLWVVYHDYHGIAHAKTVPHERFPDAIENGIVFAKANMDFDIRDQQVPYPVFSAETGDFFAVPDPDTYTMVPYRLGTARTYTFLEVAGGEQWSGCPRSALQRVVESYQDRDLRVKAAFEPECYFLTAIGDEYRPADQAHMFALDGLDRHADLFSLLVDTLRAMGPRVEQIGAEYGAGQYEINIRHNDPLRAADDLVTLKDTTRALARKAGLIASFMPKPYSHLPGCGLHVHLGIDETNGRNVMAGDKPTELSDMGRAFVGGLLAHAPALCGVGAPTVNSYKRLLRGSWSPANVCYGVGNRAALVRVPEAGSTHIEFRAGDNTCNPYLFLAALLAAGMDGIRRGLDPGAPVVDDVGHLDTDTLTARGLATLPRSAPEALQALEADAVVMEALGPVIGSTFLRLKRAEAAAYAIEVGAWERAAYLETI